MSTSAVSSSGPRHAFPTSRWLAEAALAALVLWVWWWLWRWQAEIPPRRDALWGAQAACVPGPWPVRLGMSGGHLLEALLAWLGSGCHFTGLALRWPHALAASTTVAAGAWLMRGRRTLAERWLVTLYLAGAPYLYYYAYFGRPWTLVLGFGVVAWTTRGGPRTWRWLGGTLVGLTTPFAAPLWGALLFEELVAARGRPPRAWFAEAATLAALVGIEVVVILGYVSPLIELFRYHWNPAATGWRPPLGSDLLVGSRLDPLAARLWWAIVLAGLWGAWRHGRLLLLAGGASLVHLAVWWVLRPPWVARYLLAVAAVWPLLVAAARHDRLGRLLAVVAGVAWGWSALTLAPRADRLAWNVEFRVDPRPLRAELPRGAWLLTDAVVQIEPLLWELLANEPVTIAVVEPPSEAKRQQLFGGTEVGPRWLERAAAAPWARGRVRRFATFAAAVSAARDARAPWLGAAGGGSIQWPRCFDPCPEVLLRPPPRYEVLHLPRDLPRYCGRVRGVFLASEEPQVDHWLRYLFVYHHAPEGLATFLAEIRTACAVVAGWDTGGD